MILDDAAWHVGGVGFPAGIPSSAGATHIGFFVAWAAEQCMLSEEMISDWPSEIASLKAHVISPGKFVEKCMDGKLSDADLTEVCLEFAARAYKPQISYLAMYEKWGKEKYGNEYLVPDNWVEAREVFELIDSLFNKAN